jgi:hypothetical protein
VQLQINPTFMGDTAEAEAGPEPGSRKLIMETLSIETKSETLRTMPSPPLKLDHWMALDSIPK